MNNATATNAAFVSAVEGNTQWLDGGSMFGNVPRSLWEQWAPVDAKGRIRLACRALLIECDGMRILCETGIGAFFEPKLADRFGVAEKEHVLLASLKGLGLSHSDIDVVVLSHLHFDHAGGLLPAYDEIVGGNSGLLFPRAKYLVGAKAWERAKHPHARDKASFVPGLVEKLEATGRLVVVDGDRVASILPDRLSFIFTDGHTPGQMHTVFKGEQSTIVFCGDLIPGTAWVHLPVTMGYDRYPELLIDEKAALYKRALPENWLLFYTHDTAVKASRLACDAKGRFTAASPFAALVRERL